jgi:hypothetical protein
MDTIEKFPKTIVLTINTHGGIDCIKSDNNNNLELTYKYPIIKVPTNIKNLIIIDSVPFGVDNNINNSGIKKNIDLVTKIYYKEHSNINNLSLNQINVINEKIIEQIKNDTICNTKYKKIDDKNFLRCVKLKNIYQQKKYKPDDKIVNKTLCYEIKDISNKYKNIQIINKELNNIDLFDLVKKKKYFDGYETTLENIINFFSNKDVENIIIYDFSCYTFLADNKMNDEISERTVRYFRNEINNKLNGSNKRKFDLL